MWLISVQEKPAEETSSSRVYIIFSYAVTQPLQEVINGESKQPFQKGSWHLFFCSGRGHSRGCVHLSINSYAYLPTYEGAAFYYYGYSDSASLAMMISFNISLGPCGFAGRLCLHPRKSATEPPSAGCISRVDCALQNIRRLRICMPRKRSGCLLPHVMTVDGEGDVGNTSEWQLEFRIGK